MKREQLLFFVLFLLYAVPAFAQVDTAWVKRYNGTSKDLDVPIAIATDDSGNVYMSGTSIDTITLSDYLTIKYSSDGGIQWISRYNGPFWWYDISSALAVDKSQNVYVTGWSYNLSTGYDYTTIKYAPNGDTLWTRRYNGHDSRPDNAYALALDMDGNVYVTGRSEGSLSYYDYATIKYSSSGDTLWIRRYDGPGNRHDAAFALAVDSMGDVYVTGVSYGSGTGFDYATIKYASNGDTLWVRRYNGPANGNDQPGSFQYPTPTVLAIDSPGNVFVTGSSYGGSTLDDYTTIKYSPDGDTLWISRYNGPADSNDIANAVAVDDSGNVFVTGVSRGIGTSDDIATIKYSSSGVELWVRRFDGPNGWDGGRALAIDESGNAYVSGYSRSGTLEDFITIKYNPSGNILWQMRYNGPADLNDVVNAMVIDKKGNVFVTGRSIGKGTFDDYATIKYVQYLCVAKAGDANSDNLILLSDIVTIINFLFKGSPAPYPFCRGDANANGKVLLSDIVYLINYLYKSGPAPLKSRECCL